jgi:hypothetical protein
MTTTENNRTSRIVAAGLDRVTAAIHAVPYTETRDAGEHARRAERLHRLYTRRARWWAVLERAATADSAIPTVYVQAVIYARCAADHTATDWATSAEQWTDRARRAEAGAELVRGVSA